MRKLIRGFSFVFFGLVLGFFALEIFLRMTGGVARSLYYYNEPIGLVTLPPGTAFTYNESCFSNRVIVNSWGFHAPEFSTASPAANEFRIVVVGDSYVEALQVLRRNTAYTLLEKMLNSKLEPKVHVVVYPIGISGNGTYANYLLYKYYGEKLKPNLVIDMFCTGNDVSDDSESLDEEVVKQASGFPHTVPGYPRFDATGNLLHRTLPIEKPFATVKALARHSEALVFLYHKLVELRSKWAVHEVLHGGGMPIFMQPWLKRYPPVWKRGWQNEEKLFANFKRRVKKNGARFMIVSDTSAFSVNPSLLPPMLASQLDTEKPEKELAKISTTLHITYLPLLPYFRKMHQEKKIPETFPCDGHWNETGHRWAAEVISRYLIRHPNEAGLSPFQETCNYQETRRNLLDAEHSVARK